MSSQQAIILGIIQGVTELLPVSSTGHLVLLEKFFNIQGGFLFDILVHLATFLAIFLYFRKTWFQLISAFFQSLKKWDLKNNEEQRLAWYLLIATLPAAILGFFLESKIESTFRDVKIVTFNLVIFAVLLFVADRFASHLKKIKDLKLKEALLIGFSQAIALFPGVSRSGITTSFGLFLGLKRDEAVKFSFLLSAPIILGAGVSKIFEIKESAFLNNNVFPYLWGFLAAFISGYLAIKYLLRFIKQHPFDVFVYYRIVLAIIIWLFLIA